MRKKNFVYISIELKKLTLATLAFQTEEEEDEDMKMSHEKKNFVYPHTYLFFIKYEGGSNFKRVIHLYIILSNLDFNLRVYNII